MTSLRVNKNLNNQTYFLTFTVKNWFYLFDKCNRWQILTSAFRYYQEKRGLEIDAYVFMINHIHLIAYCTDMIGFIRDFKKFTTFEFEKNIKNTEPALLKQFLNKQNGFQLWERTNMPKLVLTEKFFRQKKIYIESNPVRKGYVALPEHWLYSSAHIPPVLKIKPI